MNQAASHPAETDPHAQPAPLPLIIFAEPDGVCYQLPKSKPNIPSILLMLVLLSAIIGLPIMTHLRFGAVMPLPIAIASPILSLLLSAYLVSTILMELFGTTQVMLTSGKIRVRQSLGFIRVAFGRKMEEIRYLGVARSYAYKQTNADPFDLYFIRKGTWTRTTLAVYQNAQAITHLLDDLKRRFPQHAEKIISSPPDEAQMNVVDWLKMREEVLAVKAGKDTPVHPGIKIIRRPKSLTIRARSVSHKLPRFITHPATVGLLLAGLFALGLYHLGLDKTLNYAKPALGLIIVAWFLGGLNRFFTEQDLVLVRITPKRVQICRLSPFEKSSTTIARDRLRAVRVAPAEIAGGFCLKVQYRGLVRQSPEFLEHRPIEELAWIVGVLEKELQL